MNVKNCFYCINNIQVNYKDTQNLQRFTSSYHKIVPRRRSGLCAKHQRQVASAIKLARIMALLPFVRN